MLRILGKRYGFTRSPMLLYAITAGLIFLLSLSGNLLSQYILSSKSWDSNTINLAGRQRLLSALIVQDALLIMVADDQAGKARAANDLKGRLAQWNKVHDGLLKGDEKLRLSGDNSPDLIRLYQQLEPSRSTVSSTAEELLTVWDKTGNLQQVRELILEIQTQGGEALSWLDKITEQYSIEAQGRVRTLQILGYLFLVALLAVLAFDAAFVLRPALASIDKHIDEVNQTAEQLRFLSERDGLTGAPNRRFFEEYFQQEWQRAKRNGRSLSLIMLDVDFFKNYNDTYGHQAGDEALIKVAQTAIANARRPADSAARYGGEEFVILLPETGLEGAIQVARHVAADLEKLAVPHEASSVSSFLTVSIGVSSVIPKSGDDPADLIKASDDAMFLAKSKGRNRIAVSLKNVDS